nr:11865_t:CDS:2 [Entrophospora candida]
MPILFQNTPLQPLTCENYENFVQTKKKDIYHYPIKIVLQSDMRLLYPDPKLYPGRI